MNQCWSNFMTSYGVIMPQWVKQTYRQINRPTERDCSLSTSNIKEKRTDRLLLNKEWFIMFRDSGCSVSGYRKCFVLLEVNVAGVCASGALLFTLYIHCRTFIHPGLYSLSGRSPYRKISWSLEDTRFESRLFKSLWNLTGISTAGLPRCMSSFRAIRSL